MAEGSSGPFAPVAEAPPRPPFALIVSITLTGIMANTLVTAAVPDIVADFAVGAAGVGPLVAAATFPGIFLAPVIGVLSDRYGRREVLVPCLALFGLAGGLASFAPSFGVLVLLRLLQGVGAAGLINLAVVIIGDHWDGEERTRMIGRNAACLTAAVAVLPPIGGLLTGLGGWRWSFAPYWVGLVTAVLVRTRLPSTGRSDVSLGNQLRSTLPFLRTRLVVGTVTVAAVVFALIFGIFLTVIPLYLAGQFEVGASYRGLFLALPATTSTLSALSLGRVERRFGARPVQAAAFVLFATGFALLGLTSSLVVLCVGALVYGLGEGLIIPTLQSTVAGAAPASSRGSVVALFVGCTRAGQTVGPLVGAAGYDLFGGRPMFAGAAVLALAIGLLQPTLLGARHPSPPGR